MMWWNAWRITRVQELYWVVYRIFYFQHRVHRLVMDNLRYLAILSYLHPPTP
ncbi:hypothetical protein J6590_107556, partial [Homalodisca vitripennis]